MTQTPPSSQSPQDPDSQVPSPASNIVAEPKAVGLATTALVLGISALIPLPLLGFIFGPIAVILAIVALVKGTSPKAKAIIGLVLGGVGLVLAAMMFSSSSHTYELPERVRCMVNLKNIGYAVVLYQEENEDVFPPTLQHLIDSEIMPSGNITCPFAENDRQIDYFYFPPAKLSPDNTMMACDFRDNHDDYRNVVLVDGSISGFTEQEFQDALKEPQNAAFAAALRAAE